MFTYILIRINKDAYMLFLQNKNKYIRTSRNISLSVRRVIRHVVRYKQIYQSYGRLVTKG